MGRPIKQDFIGNTSASGQQIACYAWIPGDSQSRLSYIQEQIGTGKYYVVSDTGLNEGIVELVDTDGANVAVGEASVSVTPVNGNPIEYAEVIYDNTVRTFSGEHYKWYFTGEVSTEVDAANIQSS
jgi:hypothetical protein